MTGWWYFAYACFYFIPALGMLILYASDPQREIIRTEYHSNAKSWDRIPKIKMYGKKADAIGLSLLPAINIFILIGLLWNILQTKRLKKKIERGL